MAKTTTSKTLVWVTATTKGRVVTTQSPYRQPFMSTYTTAVTDDVKKGSIGLGTIDGQVGKIRTYDHTTISANGGSTSPGSTAVMGLAVILGLLF